MRPRLGRAMFAGCIATIAFTFTMTVVSPLLGGASVDVAVLLGSVLGGSAAIGFLGHFVMGTFVHPTVYALIAWRWLPGPAFVRGAAWGVALWLALHVGLVPLTGGGAFGAGDPMIAATSLLEHLVYGTTLGAIAGGGRRPREVEHDVELADAFRRAG